MADENVVLDIHALTDESVAGDFAAAADAGILLDFDKRTDLCFISNFTAVDVDEFGQLDVFPELYVRSDADELIHRDTASPRLRTDLSAASRSRTTRNPARPSLKGFLFCSMQSRK